MNYTSQLATSTALIGVVTSDLMQTVVYAIGAVLGIAVFLVGVGFAWRKLTKKAVGKGF